MDIDKITNIRDLFLLSLQKQLLDSGTKSKYLAQYKGLYWNYKLDKRSILKYRVKIINGKIDFYIEIDSELLNSTVSHHFHKVNIKKYRMPRDIHNPDDFNLQEVINDIAFIYKNIDANSIINKVLDAEKAVKKLKNDLVKDLINRVKNPG